MHFRFLAAAFLLRDVTAELTPTGSAFPFDTPAEFVRAQGLDGIPYVVSAALGLAYQVSRLPFAALLDERGILRARGLVNSREHLESLFEAMDHGVASIQEYVARAGGSR